MMHDPQQTERAAEHDAEVEHLLREAYEVPPVPTSLMRRLDRAIAAEWGQATAAVDTRPRLPRLAWRKAGSAGVALALVVLTIALFTKGSRAYAWASMVQALDRQGVVELEGADVTRWLSLAEGLVGERNQRTLTLIDGRQGVILQRRDDEASIRRRLLSDADRTMVRDHLVLAFLAGQVHGDALPKLRSERWERAKRNDRNVVLLHVAFDAAPQPLQLTLTLDPATQLPIACDVGPSSSHLAVTYPATTTSELRERDFPATLPVVDIVVADAASMADPLPETPPQGENIPDTAPEQSRAPSAPMPITQWQPVQVSNRSRNDVLREVDREWARLWAEHGVEPAPPADDEELLRRVYLDLAGRTPTVHEVRAYLKDSSSDRYEQLVARLVAGPDHASHMAVLWRTFLIPDGIDLTAFGGVEAFDRWLAEQFARRVPYDEIVRSLLLAEGRLSRSGPLLFYSAAKLDPDQLASRTARVFLGMRLECAQCHDHPFESWSQRDFWSLAAFFAQISRPQGQLQAASTVMQVRDVNRGEVKLPDSDLVVPPRFLNDNVPLAFTQSEARRQRLATWLTSRENPYFARAAANRVWGILFGKGIVEPVDDFGAQHPPKSPEVLDLLAAHFLQSGFDLRELFRTVALTRAYRLSSGAETADEARAGWFAQMHVKTLTAEQVFDCIAVATLLDANTGGDPYAFNVNRFGNSAREGFLLQFRTPSGRSTEYLGGIPQALTLMNGTLIDSATGLATSGLLKSLEAPFFTNDQRIEVLYLATLSRRPRPAEWEVLHGYISPGSTGAERNEGLSDLLWALLNSAEFTMNH